MARDGSCRTSMPTPEPRPAGRCHLGGLSVLVTRPAAQAEGLCALIEQAHGRPIRFPTIEILGPADKHATRQRLTLAAQADLLIFVSANAVRYSYPLLPERLPLDIAIAAVGNATAKALVEVGLDPTLVPQEMHSEGLLALPELQAIDGRSVVIVRGNGGRELLADTLRGRGAEVTQIEVYRRQRPRREAAARNLLNGWDQLVDVVVATSVEVLDNLFDLLGEAGAARLRHTPLLVVSRRVAEQASARGCQRLAIAASATDADILQALCELNEDVP